MVIAGDRASLYDGIDFTARLNETYHRFLDEPLDYRPWVNPPWFALAMAPLAGLPFFLSWLIGQAAQIALLAWTMRRVSPGAAMPGLIVVLFAPVVALNALCGQTALLACALALLALHESSRRPALAGIALALLSYKVQFVPVVVLALALRGQWRALGWAAVGGVVLFVVSLAVLGGSAWMDWFRAILVGLTGEGVWSDAGRRWGSNVYAGLAALGVAPGTASMVQNVTTFLGMIAAGIVARSRMDERRSLAALLLLILLTAPYFAAYDSIFAVVALWLAWNDGKGLAPTSLVVWSVPLLIWMIPLFSPAALNPLGAFAPVFLALALCGIGLGGRRLADAGSRD
ncbi:MAG: DUF2029 domain-containing protein [Proteobacteria bacterium]|nr:DUF2029 domain-containing protein [Pseudomonadota bacterium]